VPQIYIYEKEGKGGKRWAQADRKRWIYATEQYQVVRTSVVGLPVRQATTNNT